MQAVLGINDPAMHSRLSGIFDALNTPLNAIALFVPALSRRARWNLLSARAWRLKDELDALLLAQIAAARSDARLDQREDILAGMLRAKDADGNGLSDEQLRDELITLIIAGHETTATAIAWGVELLLRNPAMMADAREGDEAYLDALVKEILRIRAPAPIAGAPPDARAVHDRPLEHPRERADHRRRARRAQRSRDSSPNRAAFGQSASSHASAEGYSFLTFGGGAHRCIGAALAQLEIKIVLRELLRGWISWRHPRAPPPRCHAARRSLLAEAYGCASQVSAPPTPSCSAMPSQLSSRGSSSSATRRSMAAVPNGFSSAAARAA